MSFILDALKKSEAERQRQSGPALFEVKVAPPRTRLPLWAILVGALLGFNLLVLLWVLLRNDRLATAIRDVPVAAASANPTVSMPIAPSNNPVTVTPNAADSQAGAASRYVAASRNSPPTPEPQEPVAPNPLDSRPAILPETPEAAAAARDRVEARRAAAQRSALVHEQLEATAAARNSAPTVRAAGLPTRDDLVNSGRAKIPELQISLHAYDANPAKRFVFINGQRAHEGDAVANGVVLEAITRDGVILSASGQRFALPVQ